MERTPQTGPERARWRQRLYVVIFESDTRGGKAFDVVLIVAILLSTLVVMLESVDAIRTKYGDPLRLLEWALTISFTLEYSLRLVSAPSAGRYARSFFGTIDLLAILPTYLSAFLPGAQYLIVIRLIRILRVFRVLKLAHYLKEIDVLVRAMRAARHKIAVFLVVVITLVVLMGSLMYLVEGPEHGFTSIPRSMYWAIVTLTTVGYGDITPATSVGQGLAAVIMILGFGIIAVPTGVLTVELANVKRRDEERSCAACNTANHDPDARFCKRCGAPLQEL